MDLSALIFVALAVAWAVYLIPKALRHHEDSTASRGVEGFSDRMRVLARREPVDSKTAHLVVTPGKPASSARVVVPTAETPVAVKPAEPAPVSPVPFAVRRAAARRAAKRRLRVVCTLVVALVAVGVLAQLGHVATAYVLVPAGLLVAWLVACRLMVKKERAVTAPSRRLPLTPHEPSVVPDEGPVTEEIQAVIVDPTGATEATEATDVAEESAPTPEPEPVAGGWDPVPVTLPTYVDKEPAVRRSVRTIDLDSTGVWTSGHAAADSALAREADQARDTARSAKPSAERRAAGS